MNPVRHLYVLLFTFLVVHLSGQSASEGMLKGVVKGAEEPLIGATVYLKGTSKGTITDFDGNFELSLEGQESKILVVSYTGFVTEEIELTGQDFIEVTLSDEALDLNEIVVTALGVEREKKALGYAVQDVNSEAFTTNQSSNPVNSLAGKVAGVQITQANALGGGSQVTIRGNSSILGNNQPLYVIDGVPMEGDFASPGTSGSVSASDNNVYGGGISEINPDNIASMSVLKGPNAAALYGSRAANGVILITTKNGSETKGLGVDYSISYVSDRPFVVPEFQNTYGGGNGYVSWYTDGRNGGITDPGELAQFQQAYGSRYTPQGTAGVDESWGAPMDGRLVRTWWSGTEVAPLVPVPDSWENYFETGQSVNHSLSLSGANERGSFRLSMSQQDQTGIMYNNDFSKTNFRINSDYNLTDKLKVAVRSEYIKSGSDNRQQVSMSSPQTWHHRHDDWGLLKDWRDYMDVHITREGDEYPYANWQHSFFSNPFYIQDFLTNSNDKDRFLGNIALNYQFTDNLSLMVRTGTDLWTDTRINITRNERVKSGVVRTQAFYEDVHRRQESNSDVVLSYNKYFNNTFSIDAKVGAVHRTNFFKRNRTTVNDATINGLYNVANNATPNSNISRIENKTVNSVFGSLSMGYKNFLYVDVTARNDWSSTLPIDNNSYFYPSVSTSLVISELMDLSPTSVLSFAKVRGSWAQVGNDTDPYRLSQVFTAQNAWNASTPVFSENTELANSDLKPEKTTGVELGFDVRLFRNRLGFDFTYYQQTTTDQIMNIAVSRSTGYESKLINAGEIQNKGIEAVLYGTVIKKPDFSWDLSLNFAQNRNKVIELFTDANGNVLETIVLSSRRGLSLEARVGEAYGTLYGSAYKRVPDGPLAGQIVFKDGVAQKEDDLKVIGNATPDWIGGIQNTVRWKQFSLTASIDAKIGGDISDESSSTGMQTGIYAITALGREEGVIGVGAKNIGSEESPVYVPNDVVANTKSVVRQLSVRSVNEGAVFEASYVKLREMKLSYVFSPKALSKVSFIRGLSISLIGRNLAMLYSTHSQIDPELNIYGGNLQGALNYAILPSTRSLGGSINISF